ncbi:hypothetical protein AVEN_88254-1 [Araneus ventricosus]|uniref:Uncharacterized protein n=1 Tax=Araneus ventricosus TaxID=182803 RepID=A0A4Y2TJK9_ARAVE|nr:hypothetical protein AVEN_88254-1 [Araneus ventricosus]
MPFRRSSVIQRPLRHLNPAPLLSFPFLPCGAQRKFAFWLADRRYHKSTPGFLVTLSHCSTSPFTDVFSGSDTSHIPSRPFKQSLRMLDYISD